MFLETERLILRKFEEEDFEDYCGFSLGDPERDRMMGRSPLNTVEENADYIAAGHFTYNIPSRELQKKLGFQQYFREHFDLFGEVVESMENILLKEDWETSRT